MLEKTPHVKNPLTVIAIFASLAELAGTAASPFFEPATQNLYVWFLMGFPVLLVGLFFGTLWFAHHKLYAPSDYVDEQNFVTAAGLELILKREQEIVDVAEAGNDEEADHTPDGEVAPQTPVTRDDSPWPFMDVKRTRYLVAEDIALYRLSQEFPTPLKRNVSPKNLPGVVFDAVYEADDKITVVEVKYASTGRPLRQSYFRSFHAVEAYYEQLAASQQSGFELLLAVVFDEISIEQRENTIKIVSEMSERFRFRTRFRFLDFSELQTSLFSSISKKSHDSQSIVIGGLSG